ncbi:MAG: DUF554 domain-containing protein [Clostridia bacterium]|nr:DUF554 domain-containing protein [Clostridia bacterium]
MLGTIVNALAIIFGGSIGAVFNHKISERYSSIVLNGIALSVVLLGLLSAIETKNVLLLIISMAIGSLFGEFLQIEERLNKFGDRLQNKFKNSKHNIAEGFVMATLVYCVGSMAIIGSIESGLNNNHEVLFAKALLDGISGMVFATTMGIGVALSGISVFIYQGIITLLASQADQILTDVMITELSAVGGLLIMTIGTNILKVTKIKVGNMLPAVFVPVVYYGALLPLKEILLGWF